jgi:hypothetical protein
MDSFEVMVSSTCIRRAIPNGYVVSVVNLHRRGDPQHQAYRQTVIPGFWQRKNEVSALLLLGNSRLEKLARDNRAKAVPSGVTVILRRAVLRSR